MGEALEKSEFPRPNWGQPKGAKFNPKGWAWESYHDFQGFACPDWQ